MSIPLRSSLSSLKVAVGLTLTSIKMQSEKDHTHAQWSFQMLAHVRFSVAVAVVRCRHVVLFSALK